MKRLFILAFQHFFQILERRQVVWNTLDSHPKIFSQMAANMPRYLPLHITTDSDNNLIKYRTYSRRGIYNQREKYNQWPFRGLFSYVKFFFSTFFFLHLKLRTICYKKQEKKIQKIFFLRWKIKFKKIHFFFHRRFFYRRFLWRRTIFAEFKTIFW